MEKIWELWPLALFALLAAIFVRLLRPARGPALAPVVPGEQRDDPVPLLQVGHLQENGLVAQQAHGHSLARGVPKEPGGRA